MRPRAGLTRKPWVKTSLAPGSRVVTDYLQKAGLLAELEKIGFYTVGYGCTTCIGNSGPLPVEVSAGIAAGDLCVASVLSGNRNFEGRIHAEVKMNYLASPPLVVAYALAGSTDVDLTSEPLGTGSDGNPVYLKDIWPSNAEIHATIAATIGPEMFKQNYADVFKGDDRWNGIAVARRRAVRMERCLHLHQEPALLRRHDHAGRPHRRHRRRARAGLFRRLHHHRPHLARPAASRRNRPPAAT